MAIEKRAITDREQWLEWRREDVTASVVGALLGHHQFITALKLYVEKRGVEFPNNENDLMIRGTLLEPAVAKAVNRERPDWVLEKATDYYRDPELRIGATPDYFIHGDSRGGVGILQCKVIGLPVWENEWDNGRVPPAWIVWQVRLETMLTNAAFGVIAVLLDDHWQAKWQIIEVPRDAAEEAKLLAAVAAFWQDVAAEREPPADLDQDSEAIKALTAHVTKGKTLDATGDNELPTVLEALAVLDAEIKSREQRVEAYKNWLKLKMGDAESITGLTGWRVTFKDVIRTAYSVPEKTSRQLRITDKRPAHERPDADEAA
jgi:predicted phage-related endonuclease